MKREVIDKDAASPDLYTHHDNAVSKMHEIKQTHNHVRLSPNLRFDNSTGRDGKMYHLSDLSNLEHGKYLKTKNAIDRFMEIENLLPHQSTLANGFKKGKDYDKALDISSITLSKQNSRKQLLANSGIFTVRRASDRSAQVGLT